MKFKSILVLLQFIPILAFSQSQEKSFYLNKTKFDSLYKLKPSFKTDTLMITVLDSIIESPIKMRVGNKTYYEEYNQISKRVNWPKGKARYKMWYGNYLADKKPSIGVKYLIEAEAELEKIKDYPSQIFSLMRLSMALTHHTDSLSASRYIDKALALAKKIKSKKWMFQTLNYKANTHVYRDRLDLAIPIFEEIDKSYELDLRNKIINDLNLGMCYINFKKVKEGMMYLERSLKNMETDTINFSGLQMQVRMDLIENLIDVQKDYKSATKYFQELVNLFKNNGNINLQTNTVNEFFERYHKIGHKLYKLLNNSNLALFHLENRNKYADLINEQNKKNSEEGIKTQLSLSEQTKKLQKIENEKLKAENERELQLRWVLIGLSILGIFSTIYVFRTNKKLKENNKELLDKNAAITEAHIKGQTTERQRVAIDLHDNLGSTISSIKYSLEAIDRSKMNADELAVQENLYSLLDKAYNDVRLLSHNLLPEEFEKHGLVAALQGFVRNLNRNSKIKFSLNIDENLGRLDKKVEFELYSICLELVNNIIKHSKATEAEITLAPLPPVGALVGQNISKYVKLLVTDNGIGKLASPLGAGGAGLKNVQARVDSIGGTWTVKSVEGEGVINEIVM